MNKKFLLLIILPLFLGMSCAGLPRFALPLQKVKIIEYPPLDWSINGQRLKDLGCAGNLSQSCPELFALGCTEITTPSFYLGGLQPPYPIVECIHANGTPADPTYFRQTAGLDSRYRSFVVLQEGEARLLIKKQQFQQLFAPVESAEEAISYAMAMTSLSARNDLDPNADLDYLVEMIQETHVEQVSDGYIVYLFDTDRQMGCGKHSFYAVTVHVKPEGEVQEITRHEIYRSYACFDFEALSLDSE